MLALGVAACGSSDRLDSSTSGGELVAARRRSAARINGAGSTFAAPVYQQWGSEPQGPGPDASTTRPSARARGIAQFTAGTVDFGATDPAMKPTRRSRPRRRRATPVHIPTVFGAVTVSYNLAGVKTGLKLDGATIADIFLGKIKKWNDPAIAKLNPGVKLPEHGHHGRATAPTSRARRRASPTFLADYSPDVEERPRRRQDGQVADRHRRQGQRRRRRCVKQTDGAIGYVEQAYALQNNFTYAA